MLLRAHIGKITVEGFSNGLCGLCPIAFNQAFKEVLTLNLLLCTAFLELWNVTWSGKVTGKHALYLRGIVWLYYLSYLGYICVRRISWMIEMFYCVLTLIHRKLWSKSVSHFYTLLAHYFLNFFLFIFTSFLKKIIYIFLNFFLHHAYFCWQFQILFKSMCLPLMFIFNLNIFQKPSLFYSVS